MNDRFPDLGAFDLLPVSFWMSHGKRGNYRIAAWNSGAERIYGFSKREALDQNYIHLFVDDEPKVRQQSMADADRIIDGSYEHPQNCLAIDRNKLGQEIVVLTNVFRYELGGTAFQAELGVDLTPSGILNFIDDNFKARRIGPDHETQRTLRALFVNAQHLFETRRNRWVRTFAHEMGSQVSVINNALDELQIEQPGIRSEPFYGEIAHAARQISLQCTNFLRSEDQNVTDVGGLPGESASSLLGDAIQNVLDEYEYVAKLNEIVLRSKIDQAATIAHLRMSYEPFRHVLRNIVSNAVQHSKPTGKYRSRQVTVTARIVESNASVVVENSGKLREAADSPQLGLQIVKMWVEEVGGTFTLAQRGASRVVAELRWPVSR